MYCKSHSVGSDSVLACCDEEILGKTLEDNDLRVNVSEAYYMGKKVGEGEMAWMLREASSINLLGRKSVGVALKEGLITERDVIRLCGVEHAVIVRL